MVAILAFMVSLSLCMPLLAGGNIVYPISDMCGYYLCSSTVWASADPDNHDTSSFHGRYKDDAGCFTRICSDISLGDPMEFVAAVSTKSGANYITVRGVMFFETLDVDTLKSVRLYVRMFTTITPVDGDSLFLIQPSIKCGGGDCGSNVELCVTDSCNFYRCDTDVWPEDYIDYIPQQILDWIWFDIPKQYINYGDTTVFGFVTRRVPGDAPTGQNVYRTFSLESTFAYLHFYTPGKGEGTYGLKSWGIDKDVNYGGRRKKW